MSKRAEPTPPPAWLAPRRLLPDLAVTLWLTIVATAYLAWHLIDALAGALPR